MQFDEIAGLRGSSAAWRLLRADNAPLILSFLGRVFVDENIREISASHLASLLDDELYALNKRLGEGTFPRPPRPTSTTGRRPRPAGCASTTSPTATSRTTTPRHRSSGP